MDWSRYNNLGTPAVLISSMFDFIMVPLLGSEGLIVAYSYSSIRWPVFSSRIFSNSPSFIFFWFICWLYRIYPWSISMKVWALLSVVQISPPTRIEPRTPAILPSQSHHWLNPVNNLAGRLNTQDSEVLPPPIHLCIYKVNLVQISVIWCVLAIWTIRYLLPTHSRCHSSLI